MSMRRLFITALFVAGLWWLLFREVDYVTEEAPAPIMLTDAAAIPEQRVLRAFSAPFHRSPAYVR